ncbi:hypothetical protein M3568_12030 [Priestia flexa]|uniref:hypothetical protein n=1 Tax=Priestia flexa TaxID=86664 RepID=UPI00203D32FE|nr:hypothetical protein [Priestia flexa]MCM3067137.1 hypothetical protein [Priestia flexa]
MLIKRYPKKKKQKQASVPKQDPASINIPLKLTIEENKKYIQEYLDYTSDLGERWLTFNGKKALLIYFIPLMDSVKLNEHVIKRTCN